MAEPTRASAAIGPPAHAMATAAPPAQATATAPPAQRAAPVADPTTAQPAIGVPTSSRQAAAEAASTTIAARESRAAAAPAPAQRPAGSATAISGAPPRGGDFGSHKAINQAGRRERGRHLTRMRIGYHTANGAALAQLRLPSPPVGLLLGMDANRAPVPIAFFRRQPTRVAAVGSPWLAQLFAFRALGLGARVVVVTTDPAAWHGFGDRATGRGDQVAVLTDEQPLALTASSRQPMLLLYDRGVVGAGLQQQLGPWQTQLTLLRRLEQTGIAPVRQSDVAVLQRVGPAEAELTRDALNLPQHSRQRLGQLADDMVSLVGGGRERYVWLVQTEAERVNCAAGRA
ncbi:hypothetical protein GCM10009681_44690 [Luedemannella helvata]|uniref:Uncharacterized protein n=1 Tax=Luedemannella helvata TaxID=349315 RepID=A0ABP4X5U1_9ACTN